MIDLTQTTFIIPIQVESEDRYNNARVVLGFLNHHFNTNIFIYEKSNDYRSKLDFLHTLNNLKITYFLEKNNDDYFHRTKFLNKMLRDVKTPVVCNYDIDVMLPPKAYMSCQTHILEKTVDVVYPYAEGLFQKHVKLSVSKSDFASSGYDVNTIKENQFKLESAYAGHCMFFNTEIYKQYGGEEEGFVGYGPDDSYRYKMFLSLCKVGRIMSYVYHWEHSRDHNSNQTNPYYKHNTELHDRLLSLNKSDFIGHCTNKKLFN